MSVSNYDNNDRPGNLLSVDQIMLMVRTTGKNVPVDVSCEGPRGHNSQFQRFHVGTRFFVSGTLSNSSIWIHQKA